MSIISYPVKPVSFKGKYYKRKHKSNHLTDLAEIANEHLKTVNLSWDFAIDPRHGIEDILSGKTASNPRNKQIASVFKEAGIIEKYGSGIKRVKESMKNAGSPQPIFEVIGNYFKVTLFPIDFSDKNGGVNEVLNFIKENPGKNTKEIKRNLKLPQRTIERYIKELKNENKIEFRGASKIGGYYSLP